MLAIRCAISAHERSDLISPALQTGIAGRD